MKISETTCPHLQSASVYLFILRLSVTGTGGGANLATRTPLQWPSQTHSFLRGFRVFGSVHLIIYSAFASNSDLNGANLFRTVSMWRHLERVRRPAKMDRSACWRWKCVDHHNGIIGGTGCGATRCGRLSIRPPPTGPEVMNNDEPPTLARCSSVIPPVRAAPAAACRILLVGPP